VPLASSPQAAQSLASAGYVSGIADPFDGHVARTHIPGGVNLFET
jgi:hypothetical protein